MDQNIITGIILQAAALGLTYRQTRHWLSPLMWGQYLLTACFIGTVQWGLMRDQTLSPLYLSAGCLSIAVGAWTVRRLMGFDPVAGLAALRESAVRRVFPRERLFAAALVAATVVSMVMGSLLYVKEGIPILAPDAEVQRFTITLGNGIFYRFIQTMLPLLSLMWLNLVLGERGKYRPLVLFMCAAAAAAALVLFVLQGNKGTVFHYVMMLVLFAALLKPARRILAWGALAVGASLAAFIFAAQRHRAYLGLVGALAFLVKRVTVDPGDGFHQIVYGLVPFNHGFFHGHILAMNIGTVLASFRLLPMFDPRVSMPIGQYLFYVQYLRGLYKPVGGFINSYAVTVFGVPYADFGVPGVLAGGLLFGGLCLGLYALMLRRGRDDFYFPLLFYIIYYLAYYCAWGDLGPFLGMIVLNWLFTAVMVAGFYLVLGRLFPDRGRPAGEEG